MTEALGSGRLNLGVLFAIGMSMICMAALRRLSMAALLGIGLGRSPWERQSPISSGIPQGSSSPLAAVLVANYASDAVLFKYPVIPWLAIMVLGWAMGRYANRFHSGETRVPPRTVLWVAGIAALVIFVVMRGAQGYGDMFLPRTDGT